MAALVMTDGMAHYLVSEANGMYRSRGTGTVTGKVGGPILAGTVLGQLTATKKYIPLVTGASDGSQTPAAILFEEVPVGVADHKRTLSMRDCEVVAGQLIYPAGADATAKAAINTGLALLGIITR
jgi:hypothetical protein